MRHEVDAKLATMLDYLDFIYPMHTFILQIPPTSATSTMRSSFYLRLTIDLFDRSITYPVKESGPQSPNGEHENAILNRLLKCFLQFDEGWFAILTSRQWNPKENIAITNNTPGGVKSETLDITTKTILHSTILSGMNAVDDWLFEQPDLERSEIREKFGEAFWKTLEVLEGDEEGTEEFSRRDSEMETSSVGDMDVDDDMDPGMFHGFDDL